MKVRQVEIENFLLTLRCNSIPSRSSHWLRLPLGRSRQPSRECHPDVEIIRTHPGGGQYEVLHRSLSEAPVILSVNAEDSYDTIDGEKESPDERRARRGCR